MRALWSGLGLLTPTDTVAWRPSLATPQGCGRQPLQPSKPAKVSLALESAHLPTVGEGWWAGLGFRVWGLVLLGVVFEV